jgi:hypothetical protein
MSFKLFVASTFGLIKSTAKIESSFDALQADYQMFCNFEKSAELKELNELELLLNSATFEQQKKEIRQLRFKGSKEAAELTDYEKLAKDSRLRKFFATEKSAELKRFETIAQSGLPEKFHTLQKFVASPEFQQEKKQAEERGKRKFETTDAWAKQQEYLKLKSADDLKFFHKFQKSGAFRNFEKMKSSSELKRYNELAKTNGSGKSTSDENQAAELKKLEKNASLQKYLATLNSPDLKRFQKIAESGMPDRFAELKRFVTGNDFQEQKRKAIADGKREFETTGAYTKLQEYHKLQASDDVKFYLAFEKSSGFKNYKLIKDSAERKRFYELQEITGSEPFKQRVAYLRDKQKWEKSDEHKKELRLAELQKLPQTQNYLKYKNSNAFDFFRKWQLVFEDRFESGKLDPEKWDTVSYRARQSLGRNFSQPGDLQAFTEGNNVKIDGKTLKIEVRKEPAKGMQWRIPFGFVEQDFDFTSGLICSNGENWWKHGILEAKVKYAPQQNLVDAFYLVGEENSPQVNLVEMGVKNRVGMLSKSGDGIQESCEDISGLKRGEFYIFRLEWHAHSLVWKINEREILTVSHNVPGFKMHINAASVVVAEPVSNLPHRFEIDWLRFYQPA